MFPISVTENSFFYFILSFLTIIFAFLFLTYRLFYQAGKKYKRWIMRQSLFFVTQMAQMPQIYSLSRRFFLNFRPACSTRPEPTVTGRSEGAARLLTLPSVMCRDIKRADNAVNQYVKSSDALKQCVARPAKNRYGVCERGRCSINGMSPVYPGRCPGLGASALSGRMGCGL